MYKNGLYEAREGVSSMLFNEGKPPLTQHRLAKLCGVCRQTIWLIEDEAQVPSYPLAMKIYYILKKFDPSLEIFKLFPLPPEQKDPFIKAIKQLA